MISYYTIKLTALGLCMMTRDEELTFQNKKQIQYKLSYY